MKKELKLSLAVSVCMGLLFAFPLKSVCKLSLAGLPVSYFVSITIVILLSGFISYIVAKVNQNIKGGGDNININEFVYIFTLSMATTTFFILIGYPLFSLLFFSGVGIAYLGLQNVLEDLFSRLRPQTMSMVVEGEGGVDKGKSSGSAGGVEKGKSSGSEIDPVTALNIRLRDYLESLEENNKKMVRVLKQFNAAPLSLDDKELELPFWNVLEGQGKYLHNHILNRKGWLLMFSHRIIQSSEFTLAYEAMEQKTNKLMDDYFDNVEKLSEKSDFKACLKEYFNLTNGLRNAVYKELNALENDLQSRIRRDPIYKNKEFRKIFNQDYPAVKKVFVDEDSYLKKKVSEVLNAQKK